MFTLIAKRHWAKIAMPLLALLCVTACHRESTEPAPNTPPVTNVNKPTDFNGWMKLHENELTSARLAYQTAKAKHILPGQRFDKNAFDVDYKAALQNQGVEIGKLPNSVRVPEMWNPTQQTTAQYLDAHQVKGALKQYILTLEQNLRKAADKLLQEHNSAKSTARSPADDDDWGPSEAATLGEATYQLQSSAMNASTTGMSYEETEAIWMVTGMTINYLPAFIDLTKQELGFGTGAANFLDEQAVQNVLGIGRLLKRLFNVVVTVVIQAAVLLVATVAAVAANIGLPGLSAYVNVIYAATVGTLVTGMYNAVAGNNYVCFFPGDGGRC